MKADIVFQTLCNYDANFMANQGYPIPRKVIQETTGLSKYKTLKELQELRNKGLVELKRLNYYDDWDCKNYLIIGYVVTDKGKTTNEYNAAHEKVRKLMKECFKMNIGGLK